MYNNLFANNTELSKYIHSLELIWPEMPKSASIDASFNSNGMTLTIYVDGQVVKTITKKSTFDSLYVIRESDIVVVGRMPYTEKSYAGVALLPSVATVAQSAAKTVEISVKVKSPLKAAVVGNELLFDIDRTGGSSYAEDLSTGIRTINGIYPDDNGNITILSKSPEVTVNVLPSNSIVSKI